MATIEEAVRTFPAAADAATHVFGGHKLSPAVIQQAGSARVEDIMEGPMRPSAHHEFDAHGLS